MRFLCLHGKGTSSRLFEMQTAALRFELGDQHTYEFVEGCVDYGVAPEIAAMAPENEAFYAYFDPDDSLSSAKALRSLESYIEEEGPFDGVMAFSQGATLAATFLARQTDLRPSEPPPFRCAIFFAGGRIADWKNVEDGDGLFDHVVGPTPDRLSLPTCHIWGRNDTLYPDRSADLARSCSAATREELIWDGGHEVPGSSQREVLNKSVQKIRRTIDLALTQQ